VPRVITTLGADDDIRFFGEDIDDLTFAFVAPLGAYQDRVRHKSVWATGAAAIKSPETGSG